MIDGDKDESLDKFFMSPWFNPREALFWPMLPNQGSQGSLNYMSSIL
jgi:hypothetical protein